MAYSDYLACIFAISQRLDSAPQTRASRTPDAQAVITADCKARHYFVASESNTADDIANPPLLSAFHQSVLPNPMLLEIDETPTKRYAPRVKLADIYLSPTPGPTVQKYLYGMSG